MKKEYPFLVAGEWRESDRKLQVKNPFNGEALACTYIPGEEDISLAIEGAALSFKETRDLPSYFRSRICQKVASMILERKEEIARVLSLEAGKPISQARVEIERGIATFSAASEEARRIAGEVIPLDWEKASEKRFAMTKRFPIGPVLAITPFNFPFNLVAHKVAPAVACGCPVVIKPASKTPLCSLIIAELVLEAGYPSRAISVLPVSGKDADILVTHDSFRLVTFTGSPDVGWGIKERSGKKKVVLELGGNAGVIVHNDAQTDYAISRCVQGGFFYAGQSCISVQRIYIHEEIYERFVTGLVDQVSRLQVGDPLDEKTHVGPMISEEEAIRIESWVREAVSGGARILTGGKRRGAIYYPTVLSDTKPDMKVCCREVFAPLVIVDRYRRIDDAIARVNDSIYGLQAGIFTRDIGSIIKAFEEIEVGGVVTNDVPTYRADHMPYGGVKNSGIGKEGPRFAIEDMTEMRILVLNMNI
ncbi:MAG: aldehyde dehydrogenase family protein [Acidobacteriota bacterium]